MCEDKVTETVVMETNRVSITKLNGGNYLILATQLEALLRAGGVWKHIEIVGHVANETAKEAVSISTSVEPSATTTQQSSANVEKNEMERNVVRAAIICSIEPEFIAIVTGCQDPRVMWKKLADANSSKCKAALHTLRNRLLNV